MPANWTHGFYGELARIASDPAAVRLEAHALQAAVEELQAAAREQPGVLVATLMASYLALSEQLCGGQDQDRAGLYAWPSVAWVGSSQSPERPEVRADTVKSHCLWRTLARMICLSSGQHSRS